MSAQSNSFDIVSRVDLEELSNALNQARKEVDARFDFKGTSSRIESSKDAFTIYSSDEFHLKQIVSVIETHLSRRKVPLKAVQWSPRMKGPKGTVKLEANVVQGVDKDKAREIMNFIKKIDKRVSVQVQQDQLRVSSKSKDSLQSIIKALREKDFGIPLQFTNYR
ncbi:MAG: YajQ family cyclic di-GMP-binding protein [Actinomycetota bacterium]|nr:YajQ family cyclic di-GMP-binding protein [Actinomycetota bacterium]